jgi:hypothetical protein
VTIQAYHLDVLSVKVELLKTESLSTGVPYM